MYVRMRIARVENVRPKTSTRMVFVWSLDGSMGSGVTPGGGVPAGPLSRAWVSCSGVNVMVVAAMTIYEAKLEKIVL